MTDLISDCGAGLSEAELFGAKLRTDLTTFTGRAFETAAPGTIYIPGWHIDYLCSQLQKCINGELIAVRPSTIAHPIRSDSKIGQLPVPANAPTRKLTVSASVKRTGMETRLLIQGAVGTEHRAPDRSLLRLIGQARRLHDTVMNSHGRTITDLAKDVGVSPSWFTRVLRLSFLAPNIAKAILRGRQPMTVTAKNLMLQRKFSPDWSKQRADLGLA